MRRSPLKRGDTPLRRTPLTNAVKLARQPISPASPRQRTAVAGRACARCSGHPCDPAHLIDRSLLGVGQDDPLAVVPLCRHCHRLYDEGGLDLLPYLEPKFREELGFAVARAGLLTVYRRVTNDRMAA